MSDTLRTFRRRYSSRDRAACRLVVANIKLAGGGSATSCEEAVSQQTAEYSVAELKTESNEVTATNAVHNVTLLPAEGGEPVDGEVSLEKSPDGWRIASIEPKG